MNDDAPFCQEVADELGRLVDISTELRQAMLERNPDKIMEVVARGEEMSVSPVLASASPSVLEDELVRPVARRLRRLQDSNRLLATSFLKLYRQLLKPADGGDLASYGRSGVVEASRAGPMLIRQIG